MVPALRVNRTRAIIVWRHYQQHHQVIVTAEQQTNFVPSVRVKEVVHIRAECTWRCRV
jgi:hypothetical protein